MREIITDEQGTERFRDNKVVQYLLVTHPTIGMNILWDLMEHGFFSKEDIKEFYQLIGYSVGGYEEIFYEEDT